MLIDTPVGAIETGERGYRTDCQVVFRLFDGIAEKCLAS